MNKTFKKVVLGGLVLSSVTVTSWANSLVQKDEWEFRVSPYVWAAHVKGDVGHSYIGTHFINSKYSDKSKDLDIIALMLMGEARKGKFSLLLDFMYIDTSLTKSLPSRFTIKNVKATVATGFLGAGYTVFANDAFRLDLMGGVRGWHTDLNIKLKNGRVSLGTKERWVDVIGGLRGQYAFNEDFSITGWGLGGAGQAKSDWDAGLMLNWNATKNLTLSAGYRGLGVDYRRDGFVYNITQKGPILGLTYRF